jgi:apolipoprotein N-acyltransferase
VKRSLLNFLLSFAAGLLHAVSFASPWDGQPVWWVQIPALAVLAWQLDRADRLSQAVTCAWLFSLAWLAGSTWWLYISMHTYGGLAGWLAAGGVLGLSAFLALYYAAMMGVHAVLAPDSRAGRAVLFAALWLLAELMRANWLTGFPWAAAGYAHIDGPLAGYAPWAGVYGISALAALLASLLVTQMQRLRPVAANPSGYSRREPRVFNRALSGLGIVFVLGLGTGLGRLTPDATGPVLKVSLLQGNIPQDEKFEGGSGVPLALKWYGEQLGSATGTLVVAPETALPLLPQQLPVGYIEALQTRFGSGERAALFGVPLGDSASGYPNSVIGLRPGASEAYAYSKHHLVPFGEFIPPLFRWFTVMMNIPLGDFNRGSLVQSSFAWAGQRLAPNICYEDLFGEELGARFADPAGAPTIFVNLSNIGWFGDSVAIDQHLQISRMRALEFARPMIRATNTGPTVIIDHRGRVSDALPRLTRGVLTGEVRGLGLSQATGWQITPYAWWVSRLWLWPLWLGALAVVVLAVLARRQRTRVSWMR